MSGKVEQTEKLLRRHKSLSRDLGSFKKALAHYRDGDAMVYLKANYGEHGVASVELAESAAIELLEGTISDLEEKLAKIEGALKMTAAVAEEMGL